MTDTQIISAILVSSVVGIYFLMQGIKKLKLYNEKIPENKRELVNLTLPILIGVATVTPALTSVGIAVSVGVVVSFGTALGSNFLFKFVKAWAKSKVPNVEE